MATKAWWDQGFDSTPSVAQTGVPNPIGGGMDGGSTAQQAAASAASTAAAVARGETNPYAGNAEVEAKLKQRGLTMEQWQNMPNNSYTNGNLQNAAFNSDPNFNVNDMGVGLVMPNGQRSINGQASGILGSSTANANAQPSLSGGSTSSGGLLGSSKAGGTPTQNSDPYPKPQTGGLDPYYKPQTGGIDPNQFKTGPGVQTVAPINTAPTAAGPTPATQANGDYGYNVQPGIAQPAMSQGYQSRNAIASDAKATGYQASQWNVTPQQQVEDRLNRILGTDSPLMQQAGTQAAQAANGRGLLNSSMAVTAGQDAMIRSALPIAQQDAQTNASAGQFNAGASNSAKAFSAGAMNQAELQDAQLNTQTQQLNASEANKAGAFTASEANKASSTNAQIGTQASLANAAEANKAGALAAGARNTANLALYDASSKKEIAQLNASTQEKLANLDSATRMSIQNNVSDTQQRLANLDSATRMSIATAESYNKQLLQTNATAASMQNQFVQIMANIQNSTTMDEPAKIKAMNTQLGIYKKGLATVGAIAGYNLGQAFDGLAFTEAEDSTKNKEGGKTPIDPANNGKNEGKGTASGGGESGGGGGGD